MERRTFRCLFLYKIRVIKRIRGFIKQCKIRYNKIEVNKQEEFMNYKDKLIYIQERLKVKETTKQEEKDYYAMLIELIDELVQLINDVEQMYKMDQMKVELNRYKGQWIEVIDEVCEYLEVLEEQTFALVKGKKLYESFDEVMADLEDWIENINEVIDNEHPISYIESWDIGVFF